MAYNTLSKIPLEEHNETRHHADGVGQLSTVRTTLTSRFMVLAFLVALQTWLVSSVSAEVTFLNKWCGRGTLPGQFSYPDGIAVSNTGQFYVADIGNYRIQRFDADGNYETQWGSGGSGDRPRIKRLIYDVQRMVPCVEHAARPHWTLWP